MKMDKDALIKQKFWILLGVFGLLFLICLIVVMINGGGPIDEAKKNYDAAKLAVAKYPSPKNQSFLPPWENYGKTFTQHKNYVWKIAWNGDAPGKTLAPGQQPWAGQGGMYNWPEDASHPLNRILEYPDSDFPQQLREWYITKDAYGRQFDFLRQELQSDGTQPVKGQPPSGPLGAVTFRGGYDMVMRPVDFENKRLPDAEECWLAQEDFWVKRELLYVVRDDMTMAARLDPVSDSKAETKKKEEPAAKTEAKEEPQPAAKDAKDKEEPVAKDKEAAPAKDLSQQVFRNASWEVTLIFDKDDKGLTRISPKSRIKNIHVSHREQTLGNPAVPIDGAFFRVRQGESGRMFYFQGEKVPWDKERSLGTDNGFPVSLNPKQPVELEQVFDRGNTPVSSIDEIRIPYVSNRNANRPLVAVKPKRFGKNETAAAGPTGTTPGAGAMGMPPGSPNSGSANGPPPGMPGSYGMQTGGMGISGGQGGAGTTTGAQPSTDKTANLEFERDRYLFVTDQSRHLPLAFTLTVDQSHLSEILVALANSRLRFQTTQVEFRREPAGGNPNSAAGPGMPMGGATGPFPPAGGTSMRPPVFPGSGGPPGMAPAAMTTPTLENPNLVEVTIYGIASLYEKPRDDKK